ncbi:hypothetical protein Ancab_008328 [Ancistrocladus abbreviatus]
MAASADPTGNHHEHNPSNGNSGGAVPDGSGAGSAMKHNPGIATDWTAEEQSTLDEGLNKYASESTLIRYAKIAMLLPDKTVRDVALRCRWMNKKEISKRRKEDHSRKSKDKKEKIADPSSKSSPLVPRPAGHSYAAPTVSMENDDDGISYKEIGGTTGELLEENKQAFLQISRNFSTFQIHENVNLFCQARENLVKIMNSMSDSPEIMKQMPPLPVKLNEELVNSILPRRQP